MVVNKRKKNTRMRAKTTHGYGSMKKHRGAGSRGGRGNAGSGKRGDVKKPSLTWKKGHKHKGKVGFKMYNQEKILTINVSLLDQKIDYFIKIGKAEKKADLYIIDFSKTGLNVFNYNKLLGSGNVKNKYDIKIKYASDKAVKKIEKAGGKVSVLSLQKNEEIKDKKQDVKKEVKTEKKVDPKIE
jgi:large subunit ribosomal protein L15